MLRVCGIDPDLHGAIAVWDGKKLVVWDVPILKSRARGYEVNLPALAGLVGVAIGQPLTAVYVEKNQNRPKEGASSARKSGMTTGMLMGTFAMKCPRVLRVSPPQWKKAMGLTKDKEVSRTMAITLFPEYHELFARKKDHGRAEAALLALYGFRQEAGSRRKRLGS